MSILFRYKNALTSVEFNKRFADLLGSSILSGFYLKKGSGDFDVTITYGSDPFSLLITESGVRIEEEEELEDVIEVEPNPTGSVRVDTVYAKYVHGKRDAVVEYISVPGTPDGKPAYEENKDTHTLIGYIHIPIEGGILKDDSFVIPSRGLNLPNVANDVTFKDVVTFEKGIRLPPPTSDEDGVTKEYLGDELLELKEGFPLFSVSSSSYNEDSRVFELVEYHREDGTKVFETSLSGLNPDGLFTKVVINRYDSEGLHVIDSSTWSVTYDEFGNVLSKKPI